MKRLERCPKCELSLILITETGELLCPMCGEGYTSFSFSYVSALESVVDAAWAVMVEPNLLWPYEEDERALALADALDALDEEEEDSNK